MDDSIKQKILALLDSHRIMTIATLRPDGWLQATTVGYVNEDLTTPRPSVAIGCLGRPSPVPYRASFPTLTHLQRTTGRFPSGSFARGHRLRPYPRSRSSQWPH